MEITGPTSSVQGIHKAFEANAARAQRVAQEDGGPRFEQDMAELSTDPQQVGMNAKAIKTKDQMLGTLLDMMG